MEKSWHDSMKNNECMMRPKNTHDLKQLNIVICSHIMSLHKLIKMNRAGFHSHFDTHTQAYTCTLWVCIWLTGFSLLGEVIFPHTAVRLGAVTVKLPILQVLQSLIWSLTINRPVMIITPPQQNASSNIWQKPNDIANPFTALWDGIHCI